MKRKTIRITDRQGKTWVLNKREIIGFYFDNIIPNDEVVINLRGASITFAKCELAEAMPHVFAEMDFKLN